MRIRSIPIAEAMSMTGEVDMISGAAQPRQQEPPAGAKGSVYRGKGSRKKHKRAGKALQETGGDPKAARELRLRQRELRRVEVHKSTDFSLLTHSNSSSTGWQGKMPAIKDREAILQAYLNGQVKKLVASFYPIYHNE